MSALRDFLHQRALRTNPAFAEKENAKTTAKAYQKILDGASLARSRHEERFYQDNAVASSRGEAVSYDGMSPMDKWQQRNQQMILSGNPALQKQGLSEMAAYRQKQNVSPGQAPNSYREWTLAKQEGYTGSYVQWKKDNRGGITINQGNAFIPAADVPSIVDAEGNRVDVGVGTTREEAQARGWKYRTKLTDAEVKAKSSVAVSADMLTALEDLVLDPDDPVDVAGFSGIVDDYRSKGNPLGAAFDLALNAIGVELTPRQAEVISLTRTLSNELLSAMRGAQVGPAEQEKFERQLPIPGQPREIFLANLTLTKRNLKKIRISRGGSKRAAQKDTSSTEMPPAPPGFTWIKEEGE